MNAAPAEPATIQWWRVVNKVATTAHVFAPTGTTACGRFYIRSHVSDGSEPKCIQCEESVRRMRLAVMRATRANGAGR